MRFRGPKAPTIISKRNPAHTAQEGQGCESAGWRAREWKGLERTLIFLEEKVSKNDLNGKIFSLSLPFCLMDKYSPTLYAKAVFKHAWNEQLGRQIATTCPHSCFLAFISFSCSVFPLWQGPALTAATKPPQSKTREDRGASRGSCQQPQ